MPIHKHYTERQRVVAGGVEECGAKRGMWGGGLAARKQQESRIPAF